MGFCFVLFCFIVLGLGLLLVVVLCRCCLFIRFFVFYFLGGGCSFLGLLVCVLGFLLVWLPFWVVVWGFFFPLICLISW